jgi:transcriptional regulator GlxA family with amidase domain
VFAEANGFLADERHYECVLLATNDAPVRSSNGMAIIPHLSFAAAERVFDTVLVAGGPSLPNAPADAGMSAWLQLWGMRATRYGSICTGAFVLGHAGLLDGRTVTTHWQNASQLAELFPKARVENDRIYARDGALVTSAGVTAGIDLALALVGEDHGEAIALACAKRLLVVVQRQGGQSQFSPLLMARSDPTSPIARVQDYVYAHLREPFQVKRLAEIGGTSPRSIARLFVTELGVTPHAFVESVRLDQARGLLEVSDQPLKAIAFECGFASPEQMRGAFQRRLGLSPARYRENSRTARTKMLQASISHRSRRESL